MNRKQFFDDPEGYASYAQSSQFNRVWSKILKFESSYGKTLDEGYTREEFIKLFNSLLVRTTSGVANDKKVIRHYLRYWASRGELPQDLITTMDSIKTKELSVKPSDGRVRYFKNLNDLQGWIKQSTDTREDGDWGIFDAPTAILYLAWYGLTEQQIIDLPKSAVREDEGVLVDGRLVPMSKDVVRFLVHLRDSEGFDKKSKGLTFMHYPESSYLIRTLRTAHLTIPAMWSVLSRMDRLLDHVGSLRYDTVRMSGIYYRAYMRECDSVTFNLDDLSFASEVFCEDFTQANSSTNRKVYMAYRQCISDYALYKQLFC